MPQIHAIEPLVSSLAGVVPITFQIWDVQGSLQFSTQTPATHQTAQAKIHRFSEKILESQSFQFGRLKPQGYICGLPMPLDQASTGVLLALCLNPEACGQSAQPDRLKSLLEQIVMLAAPTMPSAAEAASASPEPNSQGFDDLYLFANLSKQFRSLRLKQPVLNKLMHRILNNMQADAAFLQLPEHMQYNQLQIREDLLQQHDNAAQLSKNIHALITTSTRQISENYCIINDSREYAEFAILSDTPYRLLAVGVRHLKQTFGWLGLLSLDLKKQFNSRELDIFQTLANQMAAMIANMEHHEDLERFTVNMVCSLVCAIEAKDVYTNGHSRRVHQYAMNMARRLDMPAHEIESLKWAAILHDIGKIGISERVLNKPGKLTATEYNLIKQHPLKGRSILEPIRQLETSLDAVAYHHERFNGKGYPDGLKGDQIPLAARIIGVADTFDALTSKRSYHQAKSPKQAMLVLDQVAGTQLDPYLVRIFKAAYRPPENQNFEPLRAVNA